MDANKRSYSYYLYHSLEGHISGFYDESKSGKNRYEWDDTHYPLNGLDLSQPWYTPDNYRAYLKGYDESLAWYDYLLGFTVFGPAIINSLVYNRKY